MSSKRPPHMQYQLESAVRALVEALRQKPVGRVQSSGCRQQASDGDRATIPDQERAHRGDGKLHGLQDREGIVEQDEHGVDVRRGRRRRRGRGAAVTARSSSVKGRRHSMQSGRTSSWRTRSPAMPRSPR